jgi:hypothetical protein
VAARTVTGILARCAQRGLVVVAEHGERAVVDQRAYHVDGPGRIGAVADDVAEQHDAIAAGLAHGLQAGVDRLAVGVEIGEQGDAHASGLGNVPSMLCAGLAAGDRRMVVCRRDAVATCRVQVPQRFLGFAAGAGSGATRVGTGTLHRSMWPAGRL